MKKNNGEGPRTDLVATPIVRRRKRWPIVMGVIATVLIAAGVGFTMWHLPSDARQVKSILCSMS